MSYPAELAVGSEYHSFLLRLWRSADDAEWRASLRDVLTGEVFVFAEPESMFLFMHSRIVDSGQNACDAIPTEMRGEPDRIESAVPFADENQAISERQTTVNW